MTDLSQRLADLSPEKRALLMQQLARKSAAEQGIGRRVRPERLPLSSAQQRLWILDRLEPDSCAYNVTLTLWVEGELEPDVLARALDEVARRHESLRTVVVSDDAGPYQRVLPPSPVPMQVHDLRARPTDAREPAALSLARAEAATPFDIAQGPLLRAVLIRLEDARSLLVLNAHHIAVDGWSLGILHDELRRLYEAFREGRPSPLPELPVQYADYALWQREELEGGALAKQLDYWTTQLAGRVPVLELPGDRPRPAVQSHRGAVLRDLLPADAYDAVKRLARENGATPFMVVLAAFQTLLMRYSGQTDLVVGAGVANRRRQELEPLIGFFVNTLALRVNLSGHPSFRELLAQVRECTLGAYSNQDVPIERVLEALDLDRALSHTPLFQTMLFFQNFPADDDSLPGLKFSPLHFDRVNAGTARCDLSLFAAEDNGGLSFFFEYATDLFDETTIARFSRHLQQLLREAAREPSQGIAEIDFLTPAERERMLRAWNDTARPLPADPSLHGLFEEQAARTPMSVAVEQDGVRLTYAELDAQSSALARRLAAQGVGTGDLVGLCVERTPRMLVALLGVLRSGAAYVPMDPAYPAERLRAMVEDSAARVIVTESALAGSLPAFGTHLLCVDEVHDAGQDAEPLPSASGEDTAYVIFTSGSTGRPKGVLVPHRAAVNFLLSMSREPGLRADDVLCAVTTLSFDIALLELMLPLTVGAKVALASREAVADARALASLLDRHTVTVMQATPATWRMLLDAGWQGSDRLRALCGGEPLSTELADRLLAATREVWNLYGPTETTVWSTVQRVMPGESVSVGRPVDNTQVYIVDRRLQPVPVGVPGELLIGGLGVARGYLSRPSLTAEKFIPDVFGPRAGARLYRTGDLARWRRDGRVEVMGRIDHQVKLRGFRIELGEIESVLAQDARVRHAVVICREDRPGDRRLVAYLACGAHRPDLDDMRALARSRLPDYMLPSAYVLLDELPLTPNGKVDRLALPAPESGASDTADSAPRNPEEATLAALWAEVLGLPRVGIHDDFFALGGHSLLATQLLTRIQKAFGGDIPLRTLFETPTVAGFAEALVTSRMDGVDQAALADMLDQLEGLSDDELQALLAAEDQTA